MLHFVAIFCFWFNKKLRLAQKKTIFEWLSFLDGENTGALFLIRFYCLPENVTAGDPQSGYHDCPEGYYCPEGTGLDWQACPRGTYGTRTNLYMVSVDSFGFFFYSADSVTFCYGKASFWIP